MTTEPAEDLKPGFLIEGVRPAAPEGPSALQRCASAMPRIVLALLFLTAGGMKLAAMEFEVAVFAHFGYAPWFMYLVGVLETAGGLMLLAPRFVGAGALLLSPVMLGAGLSHVAVGDGLALAMPAFLLLAALLWLAWGRRGTSTPALA